MAIKTMNRQDGKKSYRVEWYDPTGRKRTKTFREKQLAQEFERTVRSSKYQGTYVEPKIDRKLTLDVWFPKAMALTPNLAWNTVKTYRSVFANYVSPALGSTPVAALTRNDVTEWIAHMKEDEVGAATIQTAVKTLARCMQIAEEEGKVTVNPATRLGRVLPRVKTRDDARVLTHEEIDLLASCLPGRYSAMVTIMGHLGLRIGEVAALQRRDFVHTDDAAALHVDRAVQMEGQTRIVGPTKSRRTRVVPVAPHVASMIEAHLAEYVAHEPLAMMFTEPRRDLIEPAKLVDTHRWGARIFSRAVEHSGLERLTPHDLRGTAITNWLAVGIPPTTVQQWAGHSDVKVTGTFYTHPTDVQTRAAVALLEKAWTPLNPGGTVTPIR
jgi:integrase